MQLTVIHTIMAIMAAFRLVDVFVADGIWDTPRRLLPHWPWGCTRCVSVWAGGIATFFFFVVPWLNWPLAISWIYLAYGDWQVTRAKSRILKNEWAAAPGDFEIFLNKTGNK